MGGSIVPPEGRYGSIDSNIVDDALPPGNGADKRAFTYFVLGGARFLYATAARLAVISVVSTLSASADVLALSSVEVDLSSIQMGSTVTVKWRGKVRVTPPPFFFAGTPRSLTRPAQFLLSPINARHPLICCEPAARVH